MNTVATYNLSASALGYTVSHVNPQVTLLHDYGDSDSEQADIQIASGDYFITLATKLDKIAQSLPYDSAEQAELERAVGMLLYMQHAYVIVKKPPQQNLRQF